MGFLDKFKKTKKEEPIKKNPPETLSDVIALEVERIKAMTPEELAEYRKEQAIKQAEYEKKEKLLHIWVDNNLKGRDLEEMGKIDEAIKCYEENIKLKADTPHTYNSLASLYHYKKEFEKERTTLKLFFENVPEGTKVNESYKLDYIKRLENVEQFLGTGKWKFDCLPNDPKIIYYQIREAKTLLKSEDKEEGVNMLEDIIANGTYNNTVYNTLYQTYKKDKRFDDCIRVCERAIDVLGFFSNDRKERWNINLEKSLKAKEENSVT